MPCDSDHLRRFSAKDDQCYLRFKQFTGDCTDAHPRTLRDQPSVCVCRFQKLQFLPNFQIENGRSDSEGEA